MFSICNQFFYSLFLHFIPDVCIVLECPSCSAADRCSEDVLYLNVPFSLIIIQPKGLLLYVSLLYVQTVNAGEVDV